MADVTTELLSPFRSLCLSQKCQVQRHSKKNDVPYVVHMAVQTGVLTPKVAIACSDNEIRLLSRHMLTPERNLSGHTENITDVQFGKSDPNLLFSCSTDSTLRCWDLRESSDKEVQGLKVETRHDTELLCVDSNHSDTLLCAGTEAEEGEDTHLLFWDRRTNSLLGSYRDSHDDSITCVAFQPGSDTLLTSCSSDGIVCVFDTQQTSEDDALQMTFNAESCLVKLGWCGNNHSNVYCVTSDHQIYAWDALDGDDRCYISRDSIIKSEKTDYVVDCIAEATTMGDGGKEALVLAGNYGGSLSLLQTSGQDDKVICTLTGGHKETVRCMHWDAQSQSLLTGGEDSMLCLWSPRLDDAVPKAVGKMKISRTDTKKKPYQRGKKS